MSDVELSLGDVNVYDDYRERLLADEEGVPREMERLTERVKDKAVELAPHRTGRLKESAESGRDGDTWYVRFTAGYALYVEMGHRIVRNHRTRGYQPPAPYLRPALDAVMAESRG